jgi:ABC-type multidrug transport system ATPase subunit
LCRVRGDMFGDVAVELKKVTKSFGAVRALLGVSLTIPIGQTLGVLGANGSGKSTLLGLLATLSRPTTGTISFGELGATPTDVRHVLGWVGHDLLCYPDLTGRENIELAASLFGLPVKDALLSVEKRFSLTPYVDRPVRTLSRGQRQRVALARALVHRPRFLLLDEPTTGLDPSGVEQLREILAAEHACGTTIVLVTHDVAFAKDVCDLHVQLERGRIATNA